MCLAAKHLLLSFLTLFWQFALFADFLNIPLFLPQLSLPIPFWVHTKACQKFTVWIELSSKLSWSVCFCCLLPVPELLLPAMGTMGHLLLLPGVLFMFA